MVQDDEEKEALAHYTRKTAYIEGSKSLDVFSKSYLPAKVETLGAGEHTMDSLTS